MKIFLNILFCLAIIGVVLIVYGWLGPWYNDKPLHSSFSFSTAELQSFKFSIQHTGQYFIGIELENNLGLGDKDTILGDFNHSPGAIDITWLLYEGKKEILRGSTQEGNNISSWSNSPKGYATQRGRAIGYTTFQEWHEYILTIRVNKLMPLWNKSEPKILVFLNDLYETQLGYQLYGIATLIVTLPLLIIVGFLYDLRKNRLLKKSGTA